MLRRNIFPPICLIAASNIAERSFIVSVQQASAASFPREEALLIASLLALTGGYLDAYTRIVHRAFANAHTANPVFLWVYVTGGEWGRALHYVPPLFAFVLGVIMASWLQKFAPHKAPEISVLTEIVLLSQSCITGCREPPAALGFPLSRPSRHRVFPEVEGRGYSFVMATSNFRYAIEGLFAAFAGSSDARPFRRPYVFGAMCIAFGPGAAIGALMTEVTRAYSLAISLALLVIVLFLCDLTTTRERR